MYTQVVVKQLVIARQGERHYFQINIPRDAVKIVAVELGATLKDALDPVPPEDPSWLRIKRNVLVGELSLQTSSVADSFYSTALIQDDANIGVEDFFYDAGLPPLPTFYWQSRQYIHGSKKEADEIILHRESMLYGCYQDRIGATENKDMPYAVMIYIWYEVNE